MEGAGCPLEKVTAATRMSEGYHTNLPVLQPFIHMIISYEGGRKGEDQQTKMKTKALE